MPPFDLADLSHRDVLWENHLDGSIAIGKARKYDAQGWIRVFVRHDQPHASGVLHAAGVATLLQLRSTVQIPEPKGFADWRWPSCVGRLPPLWSASVPESKEWQAIALASCVSRNRLMEPTRRNKIAARTRTDRPEVFMDVSWVSMFYFFVSTPKQ